MREPIRTVSSAIPAARWPGWAAARAALALTLVALACASLPAGALADVVTSTSAGGSAAAAGSGGESALEQAASNASDTGRQVAMSLIGLAFAVAAIVLSFRRDFKEAAGVFVVGVIAVLLATPAGVSLLQDTVHTLFGSQ